MSAFSDLESQIKAGITEPEARRRIDAIGSALDEQQKRAAILKNQHPESSQPLVPKSDPSVGVSNVKVDYVPYLHDVERRVRRAWFPPKSNESKEVDLIFKIHQRGEMTDLHVEHPSNLTMQDNAALSAVRNAAPFRPLPKGSKEVIEVEFKLDYNVSHVNMRD
jgi:TonB family protein